jgi:4'-phosphopantetheinyl transferase
MLNALPDVVPGVTLWWTDLAHDASDVREFEGWLSAAEQARAGRFGTDLLRRRYVAGRAALRRVLGSALGVEPAAVAIRRGPRGRPELDRAVPSIDFNISHTDGGALIGVAQRGEHRQLRIGVDVERKDRVVGADRLARKFLSPAEQASLQDLDADARRLRFLRYWTCKEAMSKATGDGIGAPFAHLSVDLGAEPRLVAGPAPYEPAAWRLHAPIAPAGFLATVALWRMSR